MVCNHDDHDDGNDDDDDDVDDDMVISGAKCVGTRAPTSVSRNRTKIGDGQYRNEKKEKM